MWSDGYDAYENRRRIWPPQGRHYPVRFVYQGRQPLTQHNYFTMKISVNILIPAALLALISCSEPKNRNVVDVQPGAPLFPTAPAAGQAGATANVNPPHGQPGHNCAVPVGAPLNSAPAPKLNATPASAPTGPAAAAGAQTTPTPTPLPIQAPTQVAPGTNPPHGQPGHDCSIAVGAPLPTK